VLQTKARVDLGLELGDTLDQADLGGRVGEFLRAVLPPRVERGTAGDEHVLAREGRFRMQTLELRQRGAGRAFREERLREHQAHDSVVGRGLERAAKAFDPVRSHGVSCRSSGAAAAGLPS
jgi:hypothetical protein